MKAHNLTYAERARFAYNAGNTELAELLEYIVELETDNEKTLDKLWETENTLSDCYLKIEQLEKELESAKLDQ